ncbi:MAG: hypothetical protein JW749_08920, partial [Sedimentisphaerales bacterium]|nr:hypothetical protein [Sedimentisphaerales bacterium]
MNQTKISKILLALFTVVFCFGPVGQAEPIGTAFTYQGRLIDANQAADGLYDFQFKLFDEETVGSQLGQDVNTPEVDVIDGYFTVELDFGVVFDGNERWLDIGVRPGDLNDPNAYTVLSPRQEVTASPYALHAKSADSVKEGVSWAQVSDRPAGLDDGDDIGITTETDPTVAASVKDGVDWTEVTSRPAGLDDGDDVGITVESDPTVPASVKDGVTWSEVSDRPAGLDDGDDDTQLSEAQVDAYTANNGYLTSESDPTVLESVKDGVDWSEVTSIPAGFADGNDDTGDNDWTISDGNMYSAVAGNVGIGTTTPTAKLEVNGNIRTAGIYETVLYGHTWTAKESNRNWWSVAMSEGGTIQTAVVYGGQIYVSTDSGNIWTTKESNGNWRSVAMSADGTKQTAVGYYGKIYVSMDTGNTWTPKESNREWYSVAMSADGTKQTAVVEFGQIYVSTDTGNTWAAKESNRDWRSVAMSDDGTIQTAVFYGGQIYVSTDTGNTWTPKELNRDWMSVAMSADGTTQAAVVYNGKIYVSTDTGNTWTAKESDRYWMSVAMSADGTKQTAVVYNGQIYVSTDTGNNWTTKESNKNWMSVAMSADASVQTAVVYGGQIYVSYAGGSVGVGIGTTSPSQKLDVAGNAAFSGNVGIGTTSPRDMLDIQGSSFMPLVILENTNTTDGHVGIKLKRGNSDAESSISFRNPDETEVWKVGMDNAPAGTQGDFAIKTTNNASAEFTVKSSGNVG